jgi:uncharacterized protein (TIRG00374 family)
MAGELVPMPNFALPSAKRRWLHAVLACVIGAAAAVAALSFAGGVGPAFDALAHMEPFWLVVAGLSVVCSYLCLGLHVRYLAGPGDHAKRAAPMRTALIIFGLGSVLPAAPFEGFALAGHALRRRHLDRGRLALVLGFSQWFSVRGLFAVAAIDATVTVALSHLPPAYVHGTLAASIGVLLLIAVTGWLSMQRRCAEWIAMIGLRLRYFRRCPPVDHRRARGAAWHDAVLHVAGRRRDRVVLLGTSMVAWMFDGLCLYFALRACGVTVSLDILLLAYTVGILASMVPLLPAGVGVVETTTPLILSAFGVPLSTALAAVLAYRVLATLAPAIAGGLAFLGLRLAPAPAAPPATDVAGRRPDDGATVGRVLVSP